MESRVNRAPVAGHFAWRENGKGVEKKTDMVMRLCNTNLRQQVPSALLPSILVPLWGSFNPNLFISHHQVSENEDAPTVTDGDFKAE